MSGMFTGSSESNSFNSDIGNWDVSSVIDMSNMFYINPDFNQDISNWNVSSVTNMSNLFNYAYAFNQDISNWEVGAVTDMSSMFYDSIFNQDIGNWDVSAVIDMSKMFSRHEYSDIPVKFNQDLSNWDVSSVTSMDEMFTRSKLSTANYDSLLIGWSQLNLKNDLALGADNIRYSSAAAARQNIISTFNWHITDAGLLLD